MSEVHSTPDAEKLVAELREHARKTPFPNDGDRSNRAAALIESQRATIERVEREAAENASREFMWRDQLRVAEARVTALEADKAGLLWELEIARNPCQSCGGKLTEECPRALAKPCWREFHGGSRRPRASLSSTEKTYV